MQGTALAIVIGVVAARPAAAAPSIELGSNPTAARTTEYSETATTAPPPEDIETVTVEGSRQRSRLPIESGSQISLQEFELEAADLGQILNRQQGIIVRRTGGLGSAARVSLNGLSGNQVRFFLDGVPLELAGLAVGVANVPTGLIDDVIVYRGVVPARLGADALGGAIELRSDGDIVTAEVDATYLVGSFGTHRVSASASVPVADGGLFVRAAAFFDVSDNDFSSVQTLIEPVSGAVTQESVRRFHDGYLSYGGSIEAGWFDNPHVGSLSLRVFATGATKELQQGPSGFSALAVGEAERSGQSLGAALRFDVPIGNVARFFGTVGYTRITGDVVDVSTCIYSWLGDCGPALREVPGELGPPTDATQISDNIYLRTSAELTVADGHVVRLSVAPTFAFVNGEQRVELPGDAIDPNEAERSLTTVVVGLEYELTAFGDDLETSLFAKYYGQDGRTDVIDGGQLVGTDELGTNNYGAGLVARYRLAGPLDIEASYEFAYRLPTLAEYFGTPGLVEPNTRLVPESGHNANVGLRLRPWAGRLGTLRGELNGFLRSVSNLIRLESRSILFRWSNVSSVRNAGVEVASGWVSPGRYLSLSGSLTYLDARNVSSSGTDALAEGDRIPNQPYLFGSVTARGRLAKLFQSNDSVELSWTSRFVNSFSLAWESLGREDSVPRLDTQTESSVTLGYRFDAFGERVAASIDVQNVFDAELFDFFGIPRPGRAVFARLLVQVF